MEFMERDTGNMGVCWMGGADSHTPVCDMLLEGGITLFFWQCLPQNTRPDPVRAGPWPICRRGGLWWPILGRFWPVMGPLPPPCVACCRGMPSGFRVKFVVGTDHVSARTAPTSNANLHDGVSNLGRIALVSCCLLLMYIAVLLLLLRV